MTSGTRPLYRYFNGADHLYTTDVTEIDIDDNYRSEGIECYVFWSHSTNMDIDFQTEYDSSIYS